MNVYIGPLITCCCCLACHCTKTIYWHFQKISPATSYYRIENRVIRFDSILLLYIGNSSIKWHGIGKTLELKKHLMYNIQQLYYTSQMKFKENSRKCEFDCILISWPACNWTQKTQWNFSLHPHLICNNSYYWYMLMRCKGDNKSLYSLTWMIFLIPINCN